MDAEHGVISSRTLRIGYLLGMTLWVFRACFINQMDYALFGFDLRILFFYFFFFFFWFMMDRLLQFIKDLSFHFTDSSCSSSTVCSTCRAVY